MKRCPMCNRTYSDESFSFCLNDGALLSPPYDPRHTLVLPTSDNDDSSTSEATAPTLKFDNVRADKEVAAPKSAGKRRRWNDISFFEEAVHNLKVDEVEELRRLYEFSIEYADRVRWGTGPQRGSFNVVFDLFNPTRSLYTVYSDGSLDLNFGWLSDTANQAIISVIDEFAQRLKRLRGFNISKDFRRRFIRVDKEYWMPQLGEFTRAVREIAHHR